MRRLVKRLIVWALLFVLAAVFNAGLLCQAQVRLPDAVQLKLDKGLPQVEYLFMKARFEFDSIGFGETLSQARKMGALKDTPVVLVGAEDGFGAVTGMEIVSGSFFYQVTDNVAVISENEAREWFMTVDCIGSELEINGLPYRVSGVYREDRTMAGQLSRDGAQRIYVPLLSGAAAEVEIQDMFVDSAYDLLPLFPDSVTKNYRDTLALLWQFGRLQWFFLGICGAWCLMAVGVRWGRLLKENRTAVTVLICVGCFAAGLALLVFSLFAPVFPQDLLTPQGRIDPVHLFRLYVANAQMVNSVSADFWMRCAHRLMLWCFWGWIVATVAVAGLGATLWKRFFGKDKGV